MGLVVRGDHVRVQRRAPLPGSLGFLLRAQALGALDQVVAAAEALAGAADQERADLGIEVRALDGRL